MKRKVELLPEKGQARLVVNINELREYDSKLCARLLENPMDCIAPFRRGAREHVGNLSGAKVDPRSLSIGFEGSFGGRRVSPRQLSSRFLGTVVCVEGIVTRCTAVRPKVAQTVHFCEATNEFQTMNYHDPTSLFSFPTSSIYPNQDNLGNPLRTEFGLSNYRDTQMVTIQEMPERAPPGQLPRSISAVLEGDLVDNCKPGDRVQIVGVYRAIANSAQNTSGFFKTLVIANNVRGIGKQLSSNQLNEDDVMNIRRMSRKPDIFELLARSVAPSIYGHNYIKKALLLLLLGGVEKNLPNGSHIRGDINILMVGDPSTAKSQLLRFVLNTAPLAINTTGRGSSGVGLTAAVVTDKDTGERRLEAGAMVLGDRGVVCIDEFDKMSVGDRVAIHEVMEQQTVTIAKAGIHMSLNARCSVVAAANPQYGQYQRNLTPQRNVNLPDSLISRFDLLFIILDEVNAKNDARIANKVLQNHRYRSRGAQRDPFSGESDDVSGFDAKASDVFTKSAGSGPRSDAPVFTVEFLKKYIEFAKTRFQPTLTKPAMEFIVKAYAELRANAKNSSMTASVTARQLETLIRLASAHAKAHLRKKVQRGDCKVALELLKFALHNERSNVEDDDEDEDPDYDDERRDSSGGESDGGDEDAVNMDDAKDDESEEKAPEQSSQEDSEPAPRPARTPRTSRSRSAAATGSGSKRRGAKRRAVQATSSAANKRARASISGSRVRTFQTILVNLFEANRDDSVSLEALTSALSDVESFTQAEIESILNDLQDKNKIMWSPENGILRI